MKIIKRGSISLMLLKMDINGSDISFLMYFIGSEIYFEPLIYVKWNLFWWSGLIIFTIEI